MDYVYLLLDGFNSHFDYVLTHIRICRTTNPTFCEGFMHDNNGGARREIKWLKCHEDMIQLSRQLPTIPLYLGIDVYSERLHHDLYYKYINGEKIVTHMTTGYYERKLPGTLLSWCIRALVRAPKYMNFSVIPGELHQLIFDEIGLFSVEQN